MAGALVVAICAGVGLLALHREALRRVLLGAVDPRPMALFRIALGLCVLSYLVEIAPLSTYLFSDEGLIPSAAVPQTYGRGALIGYGDGVRAPAGFDGIESLVRHVAHGRWSLLFFWDSPSFVRIYLGLLALAGVGLVIGWRSRPCAVVVWLLLCGLLRRGDAHWGGEQVIMGLLFPLMFAQSGAAFGVDAWRRSRRLAAAGRLDPCDGPTGGRGAAPSDEHPRGRAAIYPRIPAWPQVLVVVQLSLCYAANGWTKTGSTWVSGETLRLAVHLDRYARLDWHGLAVALGPWPFRLATWGVLWWERLFPLLLVGLWLRATARLERAPLTQRAQRLSLACWLALAGAMVAGALAGGLSEDPTIAQTRSGALVVAALVIAVVALGHRHWPRGRRWLGWVLAPRWWLGFGVVFHLTSLVLFEIGAFASATISAYLLCGAGPAGVRAVQRLARALGRGRVPVPAHLQRSRPIEPEDPTLPHLHHDAATLPGAALAVAGVLVIGAMVLAASTGTSAWWHGGWLVAMAGLVGIAWRADRRAQCGRTMRSGPPLGHGPAGRLAAGGLVAYHVVALVAWQLPVGPGLPWRAQVRALVDPWMELSFDRQLWSMFAPNGPRANHGVRTLVVDAHGEVHDLHTELQHPQNLRRPYLRHDRWRKVEEAIGGYRKWLAPWHARYVCRRWAMDHGGEPPAEVRLERVQAPFPPMEPLDATQWFKDHAEVVRIGRLRCVEEPFAQIAPEVRARHGLAPATEGQLRFMWPEPKKKPEPLQPLWVLLALGLGGVTVVWSRRSSEGRTRTQ